jgi:hypothetical protein
MTNSKILFSRTECAHQLSISLRRVDQAIATGDLKVKRIGRRVLVSRPSMMSFLNSGGIPVATSRTQNGTSR